MKTTFSLFLLCCCLYTNAQVNVGPKAIATMNKAGKLSEEDINELKETTTLFTLQYRDYDMLAEYEKAISDVWKITKFKIIKPDELSQYTDKEGYSFFTFGGYYMVTSHGSASPEHPTSQHLTYDLWTADINKKGTVKGSNYYSRIILSPDARVFEKAVHTYGRHFSEKMTNFLYNEAFFYNWNAGLLKGYLKTVNDLLATQETRGPFTSDEDDDALAQLKKDTLYVPDYVNISYSPFSGGETPFDDEQDEQDAAKAYPYHIKYITTAQLNEMLLNHSDLFYYLVYIRSASDKFVNVYRSDKGMVYARYKAVSYNFKNKDLANIAKAIR